MPYPERLPSQEVLWPLAEALRRRFFQRTDLYAKQLEDGRYLCIRHPLRTEDIVAHLAGKITLGTYLLDSKSRARFLVLDADDDEQWQALLHAAEHLDGKTPFCYREQSRRGGHLWLFFDCPLPGAAVRTFGASILNSFQLSGIELFPKQASLQGGVGSLIRLPFGIHRRSTQRYGFVDMDGHPLAPTLREQILLLSAPRTVPNGLLAHYQDSSKQHKRSSVSVPSERAEGPVSERVKAAVSVLEFVGRYVELSDNGTGLCPFHDDHAASFAVNDEENYWHCFACQTGGSIIDFWMRSRRCSFKQALRELADMLLAN